MLSSILEEGSGERLNQRTTWGDKSRLGVATFIVGCLVAQDVIRLDIDDPDSFAVLSNAVRIISACLREGDSTDLPLKLPFEW
jgi:hypothetical protein